MNGSPCGKPMSLPVPCSRSRRPVAMRNTDCSAGAKDWGMTVKADLPPERTVELNSMLLVLCVSEDFRHLVEGEARAAWEELGVVAVADVDDDVGLDRSFGKELRLDLGRVEAAHRARVEPDRAQREDQIADLQRAALGRAAGGKLGIARKPAFRVGMREEERQVLIKLQVVARDGDYRRGHRLLDIARRHGRTQPLLGLFGAKEENAQRLLVRRRRPHLGEVERLDEQCVRDRTVEEGVVGARLGKDLSLGGRADSGPPSIQGDGHVLSPYVAPQHGPLLASAQLAKL